MRSLDSFYEQDEETLGLAERLGVGRDSLVLDVGCGSGGFLRALGRGERVGVDDDAIALREARLRGGEIAYVRARAELLPFGDATFSHVFCLNALTYMRVAPTLAEIARVLRPSGYLIVRTEGFWYDVWRLSERRIAGLRDLTSGLVFAATGLQTPSGRLWGRRLFIGPRTLRRQLRRQDLEPVETRPHPLTPTYAGRPTQVTVVARRR